MEPIVFDAALELGVPEIDDQHRELVDIYNETSLALEQHDGGEHFVQILNHLTQLAVDHCIAEEELMAAVDLPGWQAHRDGHDEMTRRIFEFETQDLLQNPELARELLSLLRQWVMSHIEEDKALAAHLHAQAQTLTDGVANAE